jgi:hypothetical protein
LNLQHRAELSSYRAAIEPLTCQLANVAAPRAAIAKPFVPLVPFVRPGSAPRGGNRRACLRDSIAQSNGFFLDAIGLGSVGCRTGKRFLISAFHIGGSIAGLICAIDLTRN